MLYVFFGVIASGKSTLAGEFARRQGLPYYNTDRVRKRLAGIEPSRRTAEAFAEGLYSPEMTRQTYQAMLDRVAEDISGGEDGAVLDGSYSSRLERKRVVDLAEELDTGYLFVQCICREEEIRRRLVERSRDPKAVSDGRWEIYLTQKEKFEPPDELEPDHLLKLDTEKPPAVLQVELETALTER